jgi:tetratricopeptide (TPR) repeat protein
MGSLQWILQLRLSLDEAEAVLEERGPAGEGILERAGTRQACGSLRRIQGRLPEAVTSFEEARALYLDAGASGEAAWSSIMLGWISRVNGDVDGGIRRFRDAVRVLTANQDHGRLCEAERGLSEALLEAGQVEEAERYALAARSHVSRHDLTSSSSTAMTLGLVRAAQGRDDDAEELLRESLALLADTDFRLLELQSIVSLAQFLRSRERLAEADELDGRLPERIAGWLGSADTYRDRTHAPLRDRSLGAA